MSLRNAKAWPLATGLNPEANAVEQDILEIPSTLTLDGIRERLGTPAGVSIWDMPDFIAQLEQAGFSARKHIVWMQSELSRPIFLMGMVLVAAAFTMRHTRFGGPAPRCWLRCCWGLVCTSSEVLHRYWAKMARSPCCWRHGHPPLHPFCSR